MSSCIAVIFLVVNIGFQNPSITSQTISDHIWEIFHELGVIKDTVERASETEMSSNVRSMTDIAKGIDLY